MSEADINGTIILGAGAATIVLGSALAFLMMQKNKKAVSAAPVVVKETVEELDKSVSHSIAVLVCIHALCSTIASSCDHLHPTESLLSSIS